jgi:uncharacterized repeat protein (TIGR01451 family)
MANVKTRIGARRRIVRISVALAVAAAWSWALGGSAVAASGPDVTITKASDASGRLAVGDTFSYTLSVGNAGTATANGIDLQDDLPLGVRVTTLVPTFPGGQCTVASSTGTGQPPHWSVTCTRASLAAGASAAATFGVKLTGDVRCGALTNAASVAASNEPSAAQGNDEASVTDTVTCPPSVQITKTAPRFAHVGSAVPLTMHVTNTGKIDLHHVTVTDPACNASPHTDGGGTLSPGEHATYRCSHTVRAGAPDWLATTATVRAASVGGFARARARAATRILKPKVTISIAPNPLSGGPGDTITYRYVVRNTGNATLTDVTVTDDHLGSVGSVPQLAPGHSVSFSTPRTLTATHVWVTNTATVAGKDASGHRARASAHAAVTIVAGAARTGGTAGNRDGTAFTGGDATVPGVAALLLALVGGTSLFVAARRRG